MHGIAATALLALLTVGSPFSPLTLDDQHGTPHTIDASVKLVLFTRDMDGGGVIKEVLGEAPELLERNGAVYVADVSGMPGLVRRLFALPAMRRRPYPVLLDTTGEATAHLPAQAGAATLLFLEEGSVARIEHIETTEALRRALGV